MAFQDSSTFKFLQRQSVLKEDVLFPKEAMSMISSAYGKRAESMKPQTLTNMVYTLCLKNGYEPSAIEVVNSVNEYIHE
jgi:hypothetical protein